VLLVRGALKDYAWGRVDGLAAWTPATGGPQAELWFGAHPSGPSPIIDGAHTDAVFTMSDAPVLVKFLAAGQPLSVQVHPTRAIAQEQWAAQHQGGPQVYADAEEKAEVLYAVEPFRAFAGWRNTDDAARIFAAIDGTAEVQRALHEGDRLAAVRAVLALDDGAAKVRQVPHAVAHLDELAQGCYARVVEQYPDDVGVLITVLLDTIALKPGEAIYVPAGVPHSYIDGLGIEVMTASDNVARLGLTSKPVFVEHALRALNPDLSPQLLQGDVLHTPVGFDLAVITAETRQLATGRYRVVLAVSGDVRVNRSVIPVGAAAICTADEPDMTVQADGTAALVSAREIA